MKKKLLPLAAAIVVFAVFTFLIPKESLSISLHKTSLTLSHITQTALRRTEDVHLEIDLSHVTNVSCIEDLDVGEMVNGIKTNRCSCGTWKNEAYGDYQLYVYQKIKHYALIEMVDGMILVVNMESREMTDSFCKALTEYLDTLR